ncbi:16S rRNA (cytosine(967)-C(5))-methyltransferase RsmB [Marinimicrobium alkaliphilum]|uniref:16S rRNA (cytosine(967)-C(5))-methyltransferase RsmB n=1 Tax=Marinimicrobium alkaliphilum TaxID=2202654 RepID=UPI000DB9D677|nr:16S rRNA (cytosine(967)-C(5))-methyltransferase RsmB [Marinimicrobium alkaliphilum]
MNLRAQAARTIGQLLRHQGSLASLLPAAQAKVAPKDQALFQELCYGCLRWQPRLQTVVAQLMDKPLRAKDSDIQALLLLGLYQLGYTRIPDHAAIGETVAACKALKKPWASNLVNGVLRQYQRDADQMDAQMSDSAEYVSAHPQWLYGKLRKAWPTQIDSLVAANNSHPPLTLRVNRRHARRDDYLSQLHALGIAARGTEYSPWGVTLDRAQDPTGLPGFDQGWVSVQDEAAQLAADLLDLAPGQRVLDACAAPGGKTGHILEHTDDLEVVALDSEARRLTRVEDNLARLGLSAEVACGDGTRPQDWWDGRAFDRLLLDAPCSATGIIRRQPDIKLLRQPEDIERLSQLQGQLLDALWDTLAPGGLLVYATCSALPAENTRVVEAFLARRQDARELPIDAHWGLAQPCGRQLLAHTDGHDGFYYARLQKQTK